MNRWITTFSSIVWFCLLILPPNSTLAEEHPLQKGFSSKLYLTSFSIGWLDDRNAFQAGDTAIIKIKPFTNSFNLSLYAIKFSLSVRGRNGNSSYVSDVLSHVEGDPTFWNISFIPIRIGEFSVVITEDHSGIADSSLHFTVTAGHIYPSACVASWMNLVNEFVAGTTAFLLILPKDAFGNNISPEVGAPSKDYFNVSASYENGSVADVLDFRYNGWNELGYIGIEFVPIIAGSLLLNVYGGNQTLSTLPFFVKSGSLNVSNTVGKWKYETNSLQIFSKLEICIHQHDQFGNLVPGFYPFDARVVEEATNLSVPIGDLSFEHVAQGIQLLSFSVSEPGDFVLNIFNAKSRESISKMPYYYTVFVGYCHGLNSVVNGTGLAHSIAGRMSHFTVYLEDLYDNPSLVPAARLQVRILIKNGSYVVRPIIFPLRNSNEHGPIGRKNYIFNGTYGSLHAFPADDGRTFVGNSTVQASDFSVAYTPEKSGDYEIWVLCGNIPLNNGNPYSMKVVPGLVDTSVSSILKFVPRVKRLVKNEVLVQLMDAFSNPIPSQNTKLRFHFGSANNSTFLSWAFVDKEDGSYIGYYLARDLGRYNICISFQDRFLFPCPLEVDVYERNYFPDAQNDSISVWEDESKAFSVLSNDYVPGGQLSIEASLPLHGSLLQYGQLFRYTPYIGYFGNDTFSYTISDVNKNVATGTVFISVLCKPPQFITLPVRLHVTEHVICPKFRGFSGFQIMYSDMKENISLTIRAHSGTVLLAPTPMQHFQTWESVLSVRRGGRAGMDLILSGHVEMINFALQFIQYLGNEFFYGNDVISLYAANKNGIQDAQVPVHVDPINDSPIIHSPKIIMLGRKEESDWLQIFDKQRNIFEFSILDKDIFNFPGNKSLFLVTFSMEVTYGTLSTSLPAHLISSAELKTKSSNQWQPLQTFVSISNHFVLKGKGVRFRGTIVDCNNAVQQLFYQGSNHGAILTVGVSDMGNYGCYPDCTEMMSVPLYTEVTINLVRKGASNSRRDVLLGMAIIIELVVMLGLGGILLYFICKCMNGLQRDRIDKRNHTREGNISVRSMNVADYESDRRLDGCSKIPCLQNRLSNFRQRSRQGFKSEVTGKDRAPSSLPPKLPDDSRMFIPLYVEKPKSTEIKQWRTQDFDSVGAEPTRFFFSLSKFSN